MFPSRSLFGSSIVTTRRPLEGGTLLADFLGGSNLLSRTRELERKAEDIGTALLSSAAADQVYTRRRGALLFTGWGQASVSSGQSNVTLQRFGLSWQAPLVLPFSGSVTGLLVSLSTQQTSGSLTVKVYIAGSASGFEAVIDSENRLYVEETAQKGEYVFEAGEQITLRITTASWAPSSADVFVMLEVAGDGG